MIGEDKLLRFSGVPLGEACTIVLRGATQQILDEAERSIHDALCVLTSTVKETRTVYGGGDSTIIYQLSHKNICQHAWICLSRTLTLLVLSHQNNRRKRYNKLEQELIFGETIFQVAAKAWWRMLCAIWLIKHQARKRWPWKALLKPYALCLQLLPITLDTIPHSWFLNCAPLTHRANILWDLVSIQHLKNYSHLKWILNLCLVLVFSLLSLVLIHFELTLFLDAEHS